MKLNLNEIDTIITNFKIALKQIDNTDCFYKKEVELYKRLLKEKYKIGLKDLKYEIKSLEYEIN
tara:strand:+ start:275 stop:466 length:192 start_codon:yes stop_codon:yes gene_type:complete